MTLACHALLKLPFAAKMHAVQVMSQTHPALVDDLLGANKLGHWPLQDFLQSCTLEAPDDAAAAANAGGETEAVTISTVHAAKGVPPPAMLMLCWKICRESGLEHCALCKRSPGRLRSRPQADRQCLLSTTLVGSVCSTACIVDSLTTE